MLEAMQGVGIFAAVAIPGSCAMWWLMSPARDLGPGFVDATEAAKRWAETMRKAESHRRAVRP